MGLTPAWPIRVESDGCFTTYLRSQLPRGLVDLLGGRRTDARHGLQYGRRRRHHIGHRVNVFLQFSEPHALADDLPKFRRGKLAEVVRGLLIQQLADAMPNRLFQRDRRRGSAVGQLHQRPYVPQHLASGATDLALGSDEVNVVSHPSHPRRTRRRENASPTRYALLQGFGTSSLRLAGSLPENPQRRKVRCPCTSPTHPERRTAEFRAAHLLSLSCAKVGQQRMPGSRRRQAILDQVEPMTMRSSHNPVTVRRVL